MAGWGVHLSHEYYRYPLPGLTPQAAVVKASPKNELVYFGFIVFSDYIVNVYKQKNYIYIYIGVK